MNNANVVTVTWLRSHVLVAMIWLSCLGHLIYCSQARFKICGFPIVWYWAYLIEKLVVRTKFDIYVLLIEMFCCLFFEHIRSKVNQFKDPLQSLNGKVCNYKFDIFNIKKVMTENVFQLIIFSVVCKIVLWHPYFSILNELWPNLLSYHYIQIVKEIVPFTFNHLYWNKRPLNQYLNVTSSIVIQ